MNIPPPDDAPPCGSDDAETAAARAASGIGEAVARQLAAPVLGSIVYYQLVSVGLSLGLTYTLYPLMFSGLVPIAIRYCCVSS
jgi:hypothetical protein